MRHASPGTVQLYSIRIAFLIRISHRKAVGDISMLESRVISSRMDLAISNFSFEFHTFLWDFDKQKFFMLIFLDRRSSVRCLCFPLSNKTFELNFSVIERVCCSAMWVNFNYFVLKARFCTRPKIEATTLSANLFRELFQVVKKIVTKFFLFMSGILTLRFLVLMHTPSCVRRCEHIVLKYFSMDSGLR